MGRELVERENGERGVWELGEREDGQRGRGESWWRDGGEERWVECGRSRERQRGWENMFVREMAGEGGGGFETGRGTER